jgi:hypothetical protein
VDCRNSQPVNELWPCSRDYRIGSENHAPSPAGTSARSEFVADLINIELARRLTSDDPPGALDGVGVVEPFASVADPERGCPAWCKVPRPAGIE